jgi:hypothetical protein
MATLWFFGVEQRGARVVMTLMPMLMIVGSSALLWALSWSLQTCTWSDLVVVGPLGRIVRKLFAVHYELGH